jgi:hypothetical protein
MAKCGKILGFGDFTKTPDNMTCTRGIPRKQISQFMRIVIRLSFHALFHRGSLNIK